jgi:hypothetical protein
MQMTPSVSPAVRGCIDACGRCERIVDAISFEMFATAAPGRSPIGAHLRHAAEHFICFLRGLGDGVVDYDARDRDESIERDPACFREALAGVCHTLSTLTPDQLRQRIVVRQTAALDSEPSTLESTVERELVFLSSHTIHHLAVVRNLCREQGVDLPEDLALAFSTAAFRQTAAR